MSDERVIPFSTGTEYMAWNEANCCGCARYRVVDGEVVEPFCEMEAAFSLGCLIGTVSRSVADRCGLPAGPIDGARTCKEFVKEPEGAEARIVPAPGQLSLF